MTEPIPRVYRVRMTGNLEKERTYLLPTTGSLVLRTLLSTTVLTTVVCPPGKVDVNTLVAVTVDACWRVFVGVTGITSTVLVPSSLPGSESVVESVVNEDRDGEGSKLVDCGNIVVVIECEDE